MKKITSRPQTPQENRNRITNSIKSIQANKNSSTAYKITMNNIDNRINQLAKTFNQKTKPLK